MNILSLAGMRHLPAFLLFLLLATGMYAQPTNYIKGKVVHGETGLPIPNASVFITNTSKGTVTNASGEFELPNVPEGTYDLIISCIGYETMVHTYQAKDLPLQLKVQLKPKVQELQTVFVEPYEKDGWKKWGKFFTDNFIGTSSLAGKCTIKNHEVLRFRLSKAQNKLTVIAIEPLMIENKALGYKIQYQLEDFSYSFRDRTLVYLGYTLFDNLNGEPTRRQVQNRKEAYYGSMTHFMSCLYNNSLEANGFEVRRLIRKPNLEKERVKKTYVRSAAARRDNFNQQNIQGYIGAGPKKEVDSTDYYQRILQQPDMLEEYGKNLLTADSLVTAVDSIHKSLFFQDYLYVVYKNEMEESEYLLQMHEKQGSSYQRSVVFLTSNMPIVIDFRGNYFMPQYIMSYGYWAWSEKIASLLPLDYELGDK